VPFYQNLGALLSEGAPQGGHYYHADRPTRDGGQGLCRARRTRAGRKADNG
jgi:hypothetical protein